MCEGTLTGSATARLAPRRLRRLDRPLDGCAFSRDDHLARRIEVGRLDHTGRRGFLAGGRNRGVIEPENRRHRAAPRWNRLLHNLAAEAHQLDRGTELERPRAHQRGEFPETVAADHRGRCPAALAPRTPGCHPRGQHRRLRPLGRIELRHGAGAHQLPQVVVKNGRGFLEGRAHRTARRG